jgi:hypothetical protein
MAAGPKGPAGVRYSALWGFGVSRDLAAQWRVCPGGPLNKEGFGMVIFMLLLVAFAGCASSTAPSASVPAPANVNGTWTGGSTGTASTITLVLKQAGSNVTGTIAGAGTLDGPIEGTVNGNTIRLKDPTGYGQTPLLNVQGDRITGILQGRELNLRRTP